LCTKLQSSNKDRIRLTHSLMLTKISFTVKLHNRMIKIYRHCRAPKVNLEQVETVVTTLTLLERAPKSTLHRILTRVKTRNSSFTLFTICQSKELRVKVLKTSKNKSGTVEQPNNIAVLNLINQREELLMRLRQSMKSPAKI